MTKVEEEKGLMLENADFTAPTATITSGRRGWWGLGVALPECVRFPRAGGPPALVGAVAGVYGLVYGIHPILWLLHKKHTCALGKVSVPMENLFLKNLKTNNSPVL